MTYCRRSILDHAVLKIFIILATVGASTVCTIKLLLEMAGHCAFQSFILQLETRQLSSHLVPSQLQPISQFSLSSKLRLLSLLISKLLGSIMLWENNIVLGFSRPILVSFQFLDRFKFSCTSRFLDIPNSFFRQVQEVIQIQALSQSQSLKQLSGLNQVQTLSLTERTQLIMSLDQYNRIPTPTSQSAYAFRHSLFHSQLPPINIIVLEYQ